MQPLLYACLVFLVQAASIKYPQCGTDYMCYARKPQPWDHSLFSLQDFFPTDSLNSDAIVMIHGYSVKHYKVVMESLKDNVHLIELSRNNEILLSCSKLPPPSNEMSFKAGGTVVTSGKNSFQGRRLRCDAEFQIPIFDRQKFGGTFKLKTDTMEVQTTMFSSPEMFFFCDPKQLRFNQQKFDKTKAYKKVSVHLSKVFCDKNGGPEEEIFGIYKHKYEYRTDASSEYVAVDKIKCAMNGTEGRKFELKLKAGGTVMLDTVRKYDVRCVADANFFCDYDPKYAPDQQPLVRTKPTELTRSALSCPLSHPYFVVEGRAPVKNATFECHNFNGIMMWTMKKKILKADGPTVHCTDKLECGTISNNLLRSTYLNEKKIPTCHEGGTLRSHKVGQNSNDARAIYAIKCDTRVGRLAYQTEEGLPWADWGEVTERHVYCAYPDYRAERKQSAHEITMQTLFAGVGAGAVASVIAFLFLRHVYRQHKEEQDRERQADAEMSNRHLRQLKKDKYGIEDQQQSGGEKCSTKSATKSSTATATKSNAEGSQPPVIKPVKRGIFTPENGTILEVEAPNTNREQMRRTLEEDFRTKYRNETFPDGYKCVYREEIKEDLEDAMQRAYGMQKCRVEIRAKKANEMAKRAESPQVDTQLTK